MCVETARQVSAVSTLDDRQEVPATTAGWRRACQGRRRRAREVSGEVSANVGAGKPLGRKLHGGSRPEWVPWLLRLQRPRDPGSATGAVVAQ